MAKLQNKVLYFSAGADTTYAYPLSSLVNIQSGSSTRLDLFFHPGAVGGGTDGKDQIKLTIADGSEKVVVAAIAKAIGDAYGDAMVVIADDENNVYVDSNVSAVAFSAGS